MTRIIKRDAAEVKVEICRYEEILAAGSHGNNQLLPQFSELLTLAKEYIHHAEFSANEIERLKTQLKEMNRSLDLASRVDPLTGLANRRDIMEKVEQEHSRAQRHQRTYSLIMAGIDDFKVVNDTHGINYGDDLLFEISCVLKGCVRNEDICARWGGDEFLFLLPETAMNGAVPVAQKIIRSVSMTEFMVGKPGIRVTVSLGIYEYNSGQSYNDCLRQVDRAMHMAKTSGKNRYIVAA